MKKRVTTKKALIVSLVGFLFFFLFVTPFALTDGTITVPPYFTDGVIAVQVPAISMTWILPACHPARMN